MTAAARKFFSAMQGGGASAVAPSHILKAVSARHREFVGRHEIGVRWKRWSPSRNAAFPVGFRRAASVIMLLV